MAGNQGSDGRGKATAPDIKPRDASGAAPDSAAQKRRAFLALLLLIPVPSLGTAASLFWWPELPVGKVVFIAGKIWVALLPLLWLHWVERSRLSWSPPRQGGFGVSLASGAVLAGIILAAWFAAEETGLLDSAGVADRAARTGLSHRGLYILGALYWITLNSLMEEYVWRWFVFRKFETLFGGRPAVLAAALGFTLHHVIALAAQFGWQATVAGSLGVFLGGVTWSWLYLRYRSVWLCYLSHAMVDVPIFLIGYGLIFGG